MTRQKIEVDIPEGKEIEAIYFTDGTCEVILELSDSAIAALKTLAEEWGCSQEEAGGKIMKEYMADLTDEDIEKTVK